jgi:hypothetical protein
MRNLTVTFATLVCLMFAVPILAQNPSQQGGGMAMTKYNIDEFVAKVDTDKDNSMTQGEWKEAGLV